MKPDNLLDEIQEKPETGKNYILKIRCKNCISLRTIPIFNTTCDKLGVLPFSKTCDKFVINPYSVRFDESKSAEKISDLLRNISGIKIDLFAAIISQESKTRKNGFRFGQKVYFKIYLDDYLSNYKSATVISANSSHVFIQGKGKIQAMLKHSSILTEEEFRKKRIFLKKKGLIEDPNYSKYTVATRVSKISLKDENYDPPSIDKWNDIMAAKTVKSTKRPVKVPSTKKEQFYSKKLRG